MSTRTNLKRAVATLLFLSALAMLAGPAAAGDWPNWRGPTHNGASDEAKLPSEWSATRNVLWAADMPGPSSSTPVIWGDRVFVASNGAKRETLHALCLNRDTGAVIWSKQLVEKGWVNARNDAASISPVTDGKLVYFMFGTSDLFALDLDGNEAWSRKLDDLHGPIGQQFGYSSSPLLYEGRLYLPILRGQWESGVALGEYTQEDSRVVCLDAATGKVVWDVHRPTDTGGEAFDSYGSAVPYEGGAKTAIVVQGGDYSTGHDPATGKELWRQSHNARHAMYDRLIPSPVIAGDLVVGTQPRGRHVFAFRPGEEALIKYEDSAWIYEEATNDVPTSLYYQDHLYILNGARKIMSCLDPATGNEIWKEKLDGSARIWASPTAGDGKIYCLDEKGKTTVLAAEKRFKILAQSQLETRSPSKSSIAIADGKLFIRTSGKLYCIAESK